MRKFRATILALSLVTGIAFIGSNAPRVYADDGGGQGGGDTKPKPRPIPIPFPTNSAAMSERNALDSEYSSLSIFIDQMLIVLGILN